MFAISGFGIGFVGGMVGLVLGVIRFPVIMSFENSASMVAGTNLGVSTLGAITAAVRHYRLGNTFSYVSNIGPDRCCGSIPRVFSNRICSCTLFASDDRYYCIV